MQSLEVKLRNKRSTKYDYKGNLNSVTTFMRHSEDRIEVKNGEVVLIDIYSNGKLIFSGDKGDLFDILTTTKNI